MELLGEATTIRLQSHSGKFLIADDDGKSVRQHRNGSTNRAHWTIEFVEGQNFVRLKSCFGKYLTASNSPFVPRLKGCKVIQTLPKRLNSALQWELEINGFQMRLKTRYGQFLCPYNGLLPLRNWIAHDAPSSTTHLGGKMVWGFDVVAAKPNYRRLFSESDAIVSKFVPFSPTLTLPTLASESNY